MGITGLIPFLEKATESTHISKFRGKGENSNKSWKLSF